jgi:hypothetical protein
MAKDCFLGLIVRQGKAYLGTHALVDVGLYLIIEPIYTVGLTLDEIAESMEKVCSQGNPSVPRPTPEELKKRIDPLLKAAKVGSWRKLRQGGVAYSVSVKSDKVIVDMSKEGDKYFSWDVTRQRTLSTKATMREVAQIILDDVQTRPDVCTQ